MGSIRHTAIVVTCNESRSATMAAAVAREFGLVVIGPCEPQYNGYATFLVCPIGSKVDWSIWADYNTMISKFKDWLVEREYEWVEVLYGHDDQQATIEDSAWEPEPEDSDLERHWFTL